MHDNTFLKNYKKWFTSHNYNALNDCAYITDSGGRNRFHNDELEQLRNHPKQPYVERETKNGRTARIFRGAFTPTLDALFSHLVKHGSSTIFATNDSTSDVLLMLADLDNKQGTGDVDCAAGHLAATYMHDQCFTEPSTWGNGRHVYFLLDTTLDHVRDWNDRADVWEAAKALTERIKADPVFAQCGVKFDGFYGLPSCWARTDGRWHLLKRGNLLKLPYVSNAGDDMNVLARLQPLKLSDWMTAKLSVGIVAAEYSSDKGRDRAGIEYDPTLSRPVDLEVRNSDQKSDRNAIPYTPPTTYQDYLRVTTRSKKPKVDPSTITDAYTKKVLCIDWLLQQTNGNATAEDCLDEYNQNWFPTGMSAEDITRRLKVITGIHQERLTSFKPSSSRHLHSFRRDEYLKTVTDLVPASAFVWKRRERLDHQRLSDFLSIKIQDAFYDPDARDTKGFFAAVTRDMSINNSRVLKKKGMIDWTLTTHTYKRLLQIATSYKLLEVVQAARRPTIDASSGRKVVSGSGAVIAPGEALPDLKAEWLKLYQQHKLKAA